MKKLSILLCVITFSAFAKAQITSTHIYEKLDSFVDNPSINNSLTFKEYLATIDTARLSKDVQLAKVISLCNLGFYEVKHNSLQSAIRSYEEAWKLYKNHTLEGYDILSSCAIPLGNLYTQTNALKEAEKFIEQYILIARRENNTAVAISGIVNLSIVYQSLGNNSEAVIILEKALKLSPQNADIWMNLASSTYATGDLQTALTYINQALEIHPNMSNAYKLKGLIFSLKEKLLIYFQKMGWQTVEILQKHIYH